MPQITVKFSDYEWEAFKAWTLRRGTGERESIRQVVLDAIRTENQQSNGSVVLDPPEPSTEHPPTDLQLDGKPSVARRATDEYTCAWHAELYDDEHWIRVGEFVYWVPFYRESIDKHIKGLPVCGECGSMLRQQWETHAIKR